MKEWMTKGTHHKGNYAKVEEFSRRPYLPAHLRLMLSSTFASKVTDGFGA